MKLVVSAISAFLILSFSSSTVLAYSGSECEVNDCSQSSKAKSDTIKGQSKAGAATKAKPATAKEQAKGQANDKVMENVSSQLQGLTGLVK